MDARRRDNDASFSVQLILLSLTIFYLFSSYYEYISEELWMSIGKPFYRLRILRVLQFIRLMIIFVVLVPISEDRWFLIFLFCALYFSFFVNLHKPALRWRLRVIFFECCRLCAVILIAILFAEPSLICPRYLPNLLRWSFRPMTSLVSITCTISAGLWAIGQPYKSRAHSPLGLFLVSSW